MFRSISDLRLLVTVMALVALAAVMAAACGEDEEAKKVAPAATQAPVVQAATAAPATAPTAAPAAVAPTAAPVAQAATAAPVAPTAAPAVVAATAAPEVLAGVATIAYPPAVQAVLDELGIEMGQPGAADGSPKIGGTIRIAGLEVKTFDQHLNNSFRLQLTNSYTHLRLLRYDQGPGKSPGNYDPVPALAESWDVRDGGNTIVFHLRKGVKWHKSPPGVDSVPAGLGGRDVVASDWLWTWDRVDRIETAARQKNKLIDVESWSSTDDYTLIAHLKVPAAGFLSLITQPLMEVLAPEVEEACGDFSLPECADIGNGAWMFTSYEPGSLTRMNRNPDYWENPRPYIEEVVQLFFSDERAQDAAFRTGQVDLIGVDTLAISGERYRALSSSNPELLYPSFPDSLSKRGIWMRQGKPPFNDINVRRAVALSIDRVGWVKGPLGGFGIPFGGNMAYGTPFWLPDDEFGDASQWLKYDPQRAAELLAQSGYGPGDIQVTLDSTADYGERFSAEAEVVAGFMNAIGIDTTLVMRDYDSFIPVWRDGAYDYAAYTYSQHGVIPEEHLGTFFREDNSEMFYGFSDPKLDALIDELTVTFDTDERIRITREASILVVDQAYNPLGPYWIYFYAQNPRIVNYTFHFQTTMGGAVSHAWIDE